MRMVVYLDDQILLSFKYSLIRELFRNGIVGNYLMKLQHFLIYSEAFFASVLPPEPCGIQLSQRGLPYIPKKGSLFFNLIFTFKSLRL